MAADLAAFLKRIVHGSGDMNDLITIATYTMPAEAEAVQALLEENGIQAFVANAEVVRTNLFLSNAVGNVKLQTSRLDAEPARRLIEEHRNALRNAPPDDEEEDGSTACLACGARIGDDEDVCPKCGWSYESVGLEVEGDEEEFMDDDDEK
jgi:hypothetical protein